MSALFKTKTTLRSKFSALGALLLVLNFGAAWGQTVELDEPTGNNRTLIHNIECGTYQVVTKTLPTERTDRTFTYTFQNNTGSTVTISNIKLNTVRYRIGNNSNTFDYIRIYRVNNTNTYVDYGSSTNNDYYPNDSLCSSTGSGSSQVRIYSTENTLTGNNNTISLTNGQLTLTNGQSISFRISKNIDNTFSSDCTPVGFSATITGPTCCPECPTDNEVSPANNAVVLPSSGFKLDWAEESYATGYTVTISGGTGSGYNSTNDISDPATTELPLPNLPIGTYRWKVIPKADGCNLSCSERTFYVVSKPSLTSPANNATLYKITGTELKWTTVTGVTSYTVTVMGPDGYYYTSNNVTPNSANASSISHSITGLKASGEYTWTVTPNGQNGTPLTELTSQAKFKVINCPILVSPADDVTIVNATSVILKWDAVDGIEYEVEVKKGTTTIGTYTLPGTGGGSNNMLALSNLEDGTYTWKVTPNVSNVNFNCGTRTFTIKKCMELLSPTNKASLSTANSITFSWKAFPDATNYSLYVNDAIVGTVSATNYTYTPSQPLADGNYTWKVVPNNDANASCSAYSFSICSNNTLTPVANLLPDDNVVLTDRNLSWSAVTGATSYQIFVAPESVPVTSIFEVDANGDYKYLVGEVSTTSYLMPILPEGKYKWVVRPKNDYCFATGCEIRTFEVKYKEAEDFSVTPSTQGKEFFFSLMENGYQNAGGNKYTAIIAPKENATVTFHYYADPNNTTGQILTRNVTAGQTLEIELDENLVYHPTVGDTYKNRTVRVTSTADISLYIANEATNSFDASIVLPTTALGNDYIIQTYKNGNHSSGYVTPTSANPCFMVIATKDDTPVRITGPSDKISALRPEPTNVTTQNDISYYDLVLNEGESYFLRTNYVSTGRVLDLSGVQVAVKPRVEYPEDSCKVIGVFNGNTLTRIPAVVENNMDHIFEQAYPINNWGTKFAITSSIGFTPPGSGITGENAEQYDYIRITAVENNTGVTINGTVYDVNGNTVISDNLSAGETKEYRLHRTLGLSCYIETTKPAACYLYQRSGYAVQNYDGDPSMVWIAPIERGISEITFSTFKAEGIHNANHYINIVIPAEAIIGGQDVVLTSGSTTTSIRSDFMTDGAYNYVNGSGNKYVYARKKINYGTYTLKSLAIDADGNYYGKMVVHVYGLGEVRGYAYAAGSEAVPYKSDFLMGTQGGGMVDIATIQNPDYHFCAGSEYIFSVNSNSPEVDSVIVRFQDGTVKTIDMSTSGPKYVTHIITDPGHYEITADVYSTIYDNATCQSRVIKETIEDYTFVFIETAKEERGVVCYGEPYTFTQQYYAPDANGNLTPQTYEYSSEAITEPVDLDIVGYSQYGCLLDIKLHLDVYSDIVPGTIESNKITCSGANGQIGLEVVQLRSDITQQLAGRDPQSSYGNISDPNAHFQWQKASSESGPWTDIENQTGEEYIVIENGWYRRAYVSACTTKYSNPLQAEASGTFNPGAPIDNTVHICKNETLATTRLGEQPGNTELIDGVVKLVLIGGETYTVNFQWQQSTDGGTTWSPIDGATACQYTIPTTYTQSTSFRRLITSVGPCTLNLSSGEYHVVVNPTFEYEKTVVNGCPNQDNAYVEFVVTGGSGDYDVYWDETANNNTIKHNATSLGNGKYRFSGLENSGSTSYHFVIEDNVYGCSKDETITIGAPEPLSIGTANDEDTKGCQGASVSIDIPVISGGNVPYRIEVESSVLGINEVASNDSHPATIPSNATAGTYSIIYKVTDVAGCYATSTQSVLTIYENPVLSLSKTNITTCKSPNGTITATVTNAPSNATYNYTINTDQAVSATSPKTFNNLSHGTYTIKVEDNRGCTVTGTTTIDDILDLTIKTSVTDANGNSIANIDGYNVICPKTPYNVNVTQINGQNTPVQNNQSQSLYEYSFDGGATFATSHTYSTQSPNTCDNQNIKVVVMEVGSGCKDETNVQVIVQDVDAPVIAETFTTIDVSTYFCDTYTVPEVDYIEENIKDYISDNCVSDDDLTVSVTPNTGTFNVADGAQTVTITVEDLCGNTATKSITITPKPWPAFKINGTKSDNNCYCHGDNIVLTAVLDNGSDIGDSYPEATYQWYKGTQPITNDVNGKYSGATTKELKISSAISTDDDATNGDDGVYKLVITYPEGCTKEATITICVHPNIKFNLE